MGASQQRSRWLRAALLTIAALMVLSIPAAAQDNLTAGDQGVISNTDGDGLNIRTEPSLDSEVHFVAPEGDALTVTSGPDEAGGFFWYGVHINGTDAWAMADYVSAMPVNAGTSVQVVGTDGHGLRLRADASLESETITVMAEGSTVPVIGDERVDESGNTWANVAYNGHEGFAHRGYLSVVTNEGGNEGDAAASESPEPEAESSPDPDPEPEQTTASEPEPTVSNGVAVGGNAQIVDTNAAGLNIRHGAGYSNSVVTVAAEGDVMHVLDGPHVDGDGTPWWNVDYKGHNGWAHGGYLQGTDQEVTQPGSAISAENSPADDSENGAESGQSDPPPSSGVGDQIVNQAMQFLGYPYVWGGTTPAGFDCSGFIYYVVNQVTGNGFPRGMEAQVNRGTHVPSDQLRPGDLVFQQNTYMWGLSHAGIYIGNGQFIHAATPGSGVVISDLWDSYWGQRYYTARRIS